MANNNTPEDLKKGEEVKKEEPKVEELPKASRKKEEKDSLTYLVNGVEVTPNGEAV